MSHHDEMDALRARLVRAEKERDTWRASGMQENYLEAYSRVEALTLELDSLHKAGLRSLADSGPAPITEPEK